MGVCKPTGTRACVHVYVSGQTLHFTPLSSLTLTSRPE